jgi:hypothetical protein
MRKLSFVEKLLQFRTTTPQVYPLEGQQVDMKLVSQDDCDDVSEIRHSKDGHFY